MYGISVNLEYFKELNESYFKNLISNNHVLQQVDQHKISIVNKLLTGTQLELHFIGTVFCNIRKCLVLVLDNGYPCWTNVIQTEWTTAHSCFLLKSLQILCVKILKLFFLSYKQFLHQVDPIRVNIANKGVRLERGVLFGRLFFDNV